MQPAAAGRDGIALSSPPIHPETARPLATSTPLAAPRRPRLAPGPAAPASPTRLTAHRRRDKAVSASSGRSDTYLAGPTCCCCLASPSRRVGAGAGAGAGAGPRLGKTLPSSSTGTSFPLTRRRRLVALPRRRLDGRPHRPRAPRAARPRPRRLLLSRRRSSRSSRRPATPSATDFRLHLPPTALCAARRRRRLRHARAEGRLGAPRYARPPQA